VTELARQDPEKMYRKLGRVAREHQDICVLDVFRAAVAQARNTRLPAEKCQWWWWSEKRKKQENSQRALPRAPRRRESRSSAEQ
jgi:hypothetical protein